jgi:hypothetical protein
MMSFWSERQIDSIEAPRERLPMRYRMGSKAASAMRRHSADYDNADYDTSWRVLRASTSFPVKTSV